MDNELFDLGLSAVNNAAQYAYMQYFITRAESDAKVMEKVGSEVKSLRELFSVEDELMNVVSKTDVLTAQIKTLGIERKNLYNNYKKAVNGLLGIPKAELATAAKNLHKHVDTYKINNYAQLDKKTGQFDNFVKDLQTKYKTDIELLGLSSFVDAISERSVSIRDLIDERDEEYSKLSKGGVKKARAAVEAKYKSIVKHLNAFIVIGEEGEYAEFVNPVNKKIERYRREVIRPRKGHKKADENTTDKAKDAKTSGKGKTGKEHKPADTTSNNDGKTELHPSADTQQPSATEQPQGAEPKQDAPKDTNEPKQDTTPQSGEPEPMKPAQ